MARLNGWQRLWVVLAAVWQVPVFGFLALLVSDGSLRVFKPPQMVGWEMSCSLNAVADATRLKYPDDYRDLSDAQMKTQIAKKYFADSPSEVRIEYWVPEEVDGAKISNLNLSCADLSMVSNPETKKEQLAVLATLDTYYPTWHKGHNVASALDGVTRDKIQESRRDRRNTLVYFAVASIIPPGVLYALGAAVAWIRRGFRPPARG